MTKLFFGNQYPTENLYCRNVWDIQMFIQEEMENIDLGISTMAREMKPNFDKYWQSYCKVLTVAVILDPRYKLSLVEFCYRKLDPLTVIDKTCLLREQLQLLFEEYLHASPSMPRQSSIASSTSARDNERYVAMDMFDTFVSQNTDARNQSQLKLYLNEPLLDRKQFPYLDILDYWRSNHTRYFELALMARDILTIPIIIVASESAFSQCGRNIEKFHSSIIQENAEAIMCSRDWLEAYSSENEEKEELSTDMEKLFCELGGVDSVPVLWNRGGRLGSRALGRSLIMRL
ncbi:hypothetical protein BUALT_Bualt11G0027700 [Buddleja alternifolia]|uniref:Uncharacterized protein n=1 Tax=Buddleja alternifolia TaxID=168488 RepID=A0AAV6WZB0_9LAMI|nr:hypothetical protein BUALT_Bualt11G0027700 [Buddleja alternifolia]